MRVSVSLSSAVLALCGCGRRARLSALGETYYDLEPLEDIVERFVRAHARHFFA